MEDIQSANEEAFADAVALMETSPEKAANILESLLLTTDHEIEADEEEEKKNAETTRHGDDQAEVMKKLHREHIIHELIKCYGKLKQGEKLIELLRSIRPRFAKMPKSKTAKMVRMVIDELGRVPDSTVLQINLCKEYIDWCIVEKRTFLRQRIQARLASLLLAKGENQEALNLLRDLQTEIKKLDDKPLLVEIFLLESRAHLALRNLPRAKASLTAARSAANSIYVGPQLQAEIDMQGGTLNASDKDYRTAFSYFFEAFESFSQLGDDVEAAKALKYMVLCKIMQGLGDDLPVIFNAKTALKHLGPEMDAMKHVANAYKERSLHAFDRALKSFPEQLVGDELVSRHLNDLQSTLLESNLVRIVEPFSRVHVARVAELIDLPVARVEAKLSQMILDKKFNGILDQGEGILVVFDDAQPDAAYDASLEAIESMGSVVDSLFRRSDKLHA
jgi:26S proteasome regulatory subunit N6